MKRYLWALLFILSFTLVIFGCNSTQDNGVKTNKAFTFSVDTGDEIRLELDTTSGYDITSDLPFEVSQNGSVLSQGIFIPEEQYKNYIEAVKTDKNAKIIETNTKNSSQYLFWNYNDSEFNIVVFINGSNTGILLGNAVSEDSARECFERLTISVNKGN